MTGTIHGPFIHPPKRCQVVNVTMRMATSHSQPELGAAMATSIAMDELLVATCGNDVYITDIYWRCASCGSLFGLAWLIENELNCATGLRPDFSTIHHKGLAEPWQISKEQITCWCFFYLCTSGCGPLLREPMPTDEYTGMLYTNGLEMCSHVLTRCIAWNKHCHCQPLKSISCRWFSCHWSL